MYIPCTICTTDCILSFLTAGTPYAGGLFRMKLVLSKNFPSEPPKGFFLTKIFHPNVASNGEICVNTLKKDWTVDMGIKQVLLVSIECSDVSNPVSRLCSENAIMCNWLLKS